MLSIPSRYVAAVFLCSVPASLGGETPPAFSRLPHTSTWLGNSHGRADGKWVQNNVLGIHVSAEGTLFTNSWWDEGRRESGIYAGADGDPVGMLESLHDSFGGGFAITGDERFIYSSNWDTVRRCFHDGARAPFEGGAGKDSDSIDVSTAPTGTDKSTGVRGLAIDPAKQLLFVSESTDNEIEVWETGKMTFVRRWSVPRAGPLAVTSDGSVWVISRKEGDTRAEILHFNASGGKLPEVITGGPGFDPTAIWYDAARKRLLVADNGPDQTIRIYNQPFGSLDKPDETFGSGIQTGTPGEVTSKKFGSNGLTGVATDAAGNFYISMNGVGPASFWHGGGTVIESRTPSGELRWRKLGLAFVDSADASRESDIGDELDVYDKYSRYRLDLGKTTPGTEWTYAGRTLDQFKYPDDQRFLRAPDGWDYTGGTFVRDIGGKRFLFVLSMQARRILIYRFDPAADGETAIPSGIWESQAGYKAGYALSPESRDFIWRDGDGDGRFTEGEFSQGPGMPNLGFGLWVDSNGDIWSCNHWAKNGIGIRRWKMQGFDPHGNPIYDYSPGNYTEYQRPEGSHGELRRVEYFPETDTLYVSSASATDGDRDAGNRIIRYANWSTPERKIAWTLDPPMDGTKISSISVAGDYLFLGYSYFGTNRREGTIQVYRTGNASYVGEITPTPSVASVSGTFDIPYAIRAFERADGEYLVFAEDDHYAKIIVHRWNPGNPAFVDELDDLSKIDKVRSSADWDIDTTNDNHFLFDKGRARRTIDTPQHLVWQIDRPTSFSAAIHFDSKLSMDGKVLCEISGDGTQWTALPVVNSPPVNSGGGWALTNISPSRLPMPPDTKFLRLKFQPTGVSWNLQLGRLEIYPRKR